ncbi:YtfJ family protein [Desulfatirhabdium butyrativorans]|uniref:YtfJ family protein n=1 Tax=Desulfatirhabdium butyrativorans TaxID=340467 RepID=UPI0004246EBE|nr:YtfJ family protein [Desulfatirhabdium butyrativorans]
MKKIWMLALCVVALAVSVQTASAEPLTIGMKAPDWSFKDADGKSYNMESWAGKVLLINYVDPDESDLNEHFTDAMKKAKDQGLLKDETYKGIGIADCKATWKPDALIRSIAGAKAKKYHSVILFDYDATLRNAWGLKEDTANAILLDKNRIVKAIVRGRVPDDQVAKIVNLAIELQKE